MNPSRKEIAFIIKVSNGFAPNQAFRDAKVNMYKKMCPRYNSSALGAQDVSIVQRFVEQDGHTVAKATVSGQNCRKYI